VSESTHLQALNLSAVLQAERSAGAAQREILLARIAELEKERDNLRASHERLRQELELFKRRLFVAKAERVDTRQLELEYAQKLQELDSLAGTLGMPLRVVERVHRKPTRGAQPSPSQRTYPFSLYTVPGTAPRNGGTMSV